MKKQINPTIKAHLLRSAFYLLLLLAVCAIPFALAQRNAAKRSISKPSVANAAAKPDVSLYPTATGLQRAPQALLPASGVAPTQLSNIPNLPRTSQIPLANSGGLSPARIPMLGPPQAPPGGPYH